MDFPLDNMASWRGRRSKSPTSNLTYEQELEEDRRKEAKERQEAYAKDAEQDMIRWRREEKKEKDREEEEARLNQERLDGIKSVLRRGYPRGRSKQQTMKQIKKRVLPRDFLSRHFETNSGGTKRKTKQQRKKTKRKTKKQRKQSKKRKTKNKKQRK